MIVLDVKEYCHHGCMDFEPLVQKAEEYYGDGSVYIRCENAKRCDYMIRYLTKHADDTSQKN